MNTRKRTITSGISFHKKAPRLRNDLDPFLDLFTDEILSYRISKQPNAKALLKVQRKAIERTKDCPYHHAFFRSMLSQMKQYKRQVTSHNIFQIISQKGNWFDHSSMKNFFGLLHLEMGYGLLYSSSEQLEPAVEEWIYDFTITIVSKKLGCSPVQYRDRFVTKIPTRFLQSVFGLTAGAHQTSFRRYICLNKFIHFFKTEDSYYSTGLM